MRCAGRQRVLPHLHHVLHPRQTFGWELGRYRGKLVRQLPDAVQLVISATRAGLPVTEAFQAIASEMPSPARDEFVRVANEVTLGVPAEDALLACIGAPG